MKKRVGQYLIFLLFVGLMMYKDKNKQRESNRERQRRYKAKHKGVTSEGVTGKALLAGNMSIETLAMMDAGCGDKLTHGLKRGKDIKVFADLSLFVQKTINSLSDDEQEHAKRTAIAINYQHLFPDRYYSTGAGC